MQRIEYTTADQLPMGTAAELKTGKRSGYSAKKTKGSNTAECVHTRTKRLEALFPPLLLISWSMYPPISWVWTKMIKGKEARSKTVFQSTGYTAKLRK